MKHLSLKAKCDLTIAPLIVLFLALTFVLAGSAWRVREAAARVEDESLDALWSSRMSRASASYETDYWEMLSSSRSSEQSQTEADAKELERQIEGFRRENIRAADNEDAVKALSFMKGIRASQAQLADAAQVYEEAKDELSRYRATLVVNELLRSTTEPARSFALEIEHEVTYRTRELEAAVNTLFSPHSALSQAAHHIAPEAQQIALSQHFILSFSEELTAVAKYEVVDDSSVASAVRRHEVEMLHDQTVAALENFAKTTPPADQKSIIASIKGRYDSITSIILQLIDEPQHSRPVNREALSDKLEIEVNSLNRDFDQLATLQDIDLRLSLGRLRQTLRRTEITVGALCLVFLATAGSLPYLVRRRILTPVSHVVEALGKLKSGELGVRLKVETTDEVGELAEGFNSLTEALQTSNRERHQAELMVRDSEERVRMILDSAAEAICGTDVNGACTFCNPAAVRLLGYERPEQILGKNLHKLIHHSRADGTPLPVEECRIFQALQSGTGSHAEDEVLWRADGTSFPVEYWSYPQKRGNEILGAVSTFIDITDRKAADSRIHSLAYYDSLTGLPNRVLLEDRLKQALARARRHHERVAVLFLDLDGFKNVNDSLGHSVGDLLLKQAAERLQRCCREQDTVARLGGDEFVVLLTSAGDASDVAVAADRITKTLNDDFVVLEHSLHVSCSLGISIFPDHANDAESLVKNADAAMYRAKENGRNNAQFFSHDMNVQVMERLILENNLRRALDRHELFLMYQPQVDIGTHTIIGSEALLRWQHPELGLVPPDKFIPIAESSGLILPIGEWVLRTACAQAKEWQMQGLSFPVSVNISAVQFRHKGFTELVRTVLKETGLDAKYLELEITESLVMSTADSTFPTFRELKEIGVKLSIDDFGTGYCSLSYLRHFPVYKLKIDRSFVRDLVVDPDDATITGTIINMAKNLGLKVIAEGVEDQAQVMFLQSHGCDEAQGYLFGKPALPSDLAKKFLTSDETWFVAD